MCKAATLTVRFLTSPRKLLATNTAYAVPEIQGTTQEVAREKVERAAEVLGTACITEDTALCFKAMNGLPGPYIKYFLKELGHSGTY
jgi:inosine/xanthosine triphosphate pyrophosphatase family protein